MKSDTPQYLSREHPSKSPSPLWLIIPGLLFCLWFPHGFGNGYLRIARAGTASALISQLSQAAKSYELDFATYPPGDGTGSRSLADHLERRGAKNMSYFEFSPELRIANGNIKNPVDEGKIIYYRCPGMKNPKTFDLWCEDGTGRADGINNWEQ